MMVRFPDPARFAERVGAFAEKVASSKALAERLAAPRSEADEATSLLEEALETVRVQHEELVVAEEELREQVDELTRALGSVQLEREKYRELFEAAPDACFVTDRMGIIREANARGCELLELDARYVRGKPLTLYVATEHGSVLRNVLGHTGDDAIDVRLEMRSRKHNTVRVRLRGARLDGGRRIFWTAREDESVLPEGAEVTRALRDKTELLERETKRRMDVERESSAKDRFLAILSHDLRAPLNAVIGWTELLRRELLDQRRREAALATIDRNARAMLGLVEELLDISRVTADKLQLDVRPLDFSALVRRLVESFTPAASDAGVVLSCTTEDAIVVVADVKRMEQAVTNLLSNSLQHTPPGGQVDVTLLREDGRALLTLRDTGKGIAPETLPRVFDCFVQGGDDGSHPARGLGLGLFIVRQVALLHGGSVVAKSDGVGLGATFELTLPLAESVPAPPESTLAVDPGADLSGLRVLVVDDEADARELLCTLLARAGAHLASASNVSDAVTMLESWRPDAIVSDIALGGAEDGCAVARAARNVLGADVAAVALSGYASDQDARASLAAGFDAHLAKPFRAGELVDVLARCVRARRS